MRRPADQVSLEQVQRVVEPVLANVARAIVHKDDEVRLCLVTLLCQGHLLIEDVPGVGKTMLARALASIVLPTPGTSSISRCPWQRRVTRQRRTSSSLCTIALATLASTGSTTLCTCSSETWSAGLLMLRGPPRL